MIRKYYRTKQGYIKLKLRGFKNDGDVLIDKEDYEKVKHLPWKIDNNGYVRASVGKPTVTYSLHKFIMGEKEGYEIDHINRNRLDNRKSINLRFATKSENNLNRTKLSNNTSGRTGVRYKKRKDRSDCWVAQYEINAKRYEKAFSVEKYGYNEAYNMAVEFREEGERKFNILTEK